MRHPIDYTYSIYSGLQLDLNINKKSQAQLGKHYKTTLYRSKSDVIEQDDINKSDLLDKFNNDLKFHSLPA